MNEVPTNPELALMVFISLDQLLPSAEKYGQHHLSIYGLCIGMAIMALSLILLK